MRFSGRRGSRRRAPGPSPTSSGRSSRPYSERRRRWRAISSPREIPRRFSRNREFAKKAFDITVQNTRDVAELATRTTTDATKIIRDRLRERLNELGASLRRTEGEFPE